MDHHRVYCRVVGEHREHSVPLNASRALRPVLAGSRERIDCVTLPIPRRTCAGLEEIRAMRIPSSRGQ